jgi:hypothetical protein
LVGFQYVLCFDWPTKDAAERTCHEKLEPLDRAAAAAAQPRGENARALRRLGLEEGLDAERLPGRLARGDGGVEAPARERERGAEVVEVEVGKDVVQHVGVDEV